MPRKKLILKKRLQPDPVYKSLSVSRFTNMIMSDGKKRTAEKIMYSALEIISKNNKEDPIVMMDKALQNVSPSVEVKSRRVGGSNYQVPVEVNPRRKIVVEDRDAAAMSDTELADELEAQIHHLRVVDGDG